MLYQVMYRLPGSEWREFGLPVNAFAIGAARAQCEAMYTGARVVVVEGATSQSLREAVARQATAQLDAPTLDRRREALEMGPGGDHDTDEVYSPTEQELLKWARLLGKVQRGELNEEAG